MTTDISTVVSIIAHTTSSNGVRMTAKLCGVSKSTVQKWTRVVGAGCAILLDEKLRNLTAHCLELDELHTFVHTKDRHLRLDSDESHGDTWAYVALDVVSRAVVCHRLGKRVRESTEAFVDELRNRIAGKPQITTDGHAGYVTALKKAFGDDVHFAQVVKKYESGRSYRGKVAADRYVSSAKVPIFGSPDMRKAGTSHVERFNGTVRMRVPGFGRKSYEHAKNFDQLRAHFDTFIAIYNFVEPHGAHMRTPAQVLGVSDGPWSLFDLVEAAIAAYVSRVPGSPNDPEGADPSHRTHESPQKALVRVEPSGAASAPRPLKPKRPSRPKLNHRQVLIMLALYTDGPQGHIGRIAEKAFPTTPPRRAWSWVRNNLPRLVKLGLVEYTSLGEFRGVDVVDPPTVEVAPSCSLDVAANTNYGSY